MGGALAGKLPIKLTLGKDGLRPASSQLFYLSRGQGAQGCPSGYRPELETDRVAVSAGRASFPTGQVGTER